MSLASVYAVTVATEEAKVVTAAATKPADLLVASTTISVTKDGGLYVNKETTLSASDALKLRDWLTTNFGL